jgi:A/G-specific adenine glycosylase
MDGRVPAFVAEVWAYYKANGRHDLPWRQPGKHGFDPYAIMVSEVMLQQTQVSRAIVKYAEFLAAFPTVAHLAKAPLADVLRVWSGLGYNRRAKFLWQAAQAIQSQGGVFPKTAGELVQLPGVGVNTAGAIAAYAFDRPVVFIETNIRTVFIHHFFEDHDDITDKQLTPYIEQALQHSGASGQAAREWYWALMDYGTHIKQVVGNASRRSKTYTKQSAFQGSRRQIRGHVLRLLAEQPQSITELQAHISDNRLPEVLQALQDESFISFREEHYHLGSA